MHQPEDQALQAHQASTRTAVVALILATFFWGCSFTVAKTAGEAVNSACGFGNGAPFGPIFVLAARFILAGALWFAIFPDSRRGWTRQDVIRSLILGAILSAGMIVQHLGLDRTSEAVSAFLTSLTILFVPLMMTFVLRQPPKPILWVGTGLATIGVWLMTGAAPSGFGLGELLGLSCAIVYSVDIIVLNYLIKPANVSRLTAGQFIIVGISNLIVCFLLPAGSESLLRSAQAMAQATVWFNILILAIFPTIAAFGLQFRFQPRIDPSRAALIYLVEPIFASLFALAISGRGLEPIAIAGAALIIVANLLVEMVASRQAISTPVID